MMRAACFVSIVVIAASAASAEPPAPAKADLDRLDCRWTFGNHEPLAMYRRAGSRATGGMEGGALWLEDWHRWFDSEASTRLMEDLGLNILHCRFYKGLGWQYESRDFPNVQRFVENCHKHGIRVLAYVQFSTLYYETMLAEIPDLADWAAIDENGRKRTYHGPAYYRWRPCINAPGFEPYLKKVVAIALGEGGFDGIMFDNCDAPPCHCPRCAALFRKHLAEIPDPENRFGLPTVAHVLPPVRTGFGEIQDPVYQEWIRFHSARLGDLYRRLYRHAKACKPSAIVSGNIQNIRRANMAARSGLIATDLADCFDVFVSQSGNAPGVVDGCVVNRVRELKLAGAAKTSILAFCDSDAGGAAEDKTKGEALALVEDAVFGGIPTDRTVLKADREMVSPERVALHRSLLERFNATVRSGRKGLAAESYQPVRLLYPRESLMFSEQSHRALLSAEEILLRNHVPYGLLPTEAAAPLPIPGDCEVLLVCDQRCLAGSQIEALVRFARGGGRLIVTGQSGWYDESYRQRRENPLAKGLAGCRTARRRGQVDQAPIKGSGWTIQVAPPTDGGRRLLEDLAALWSPPIRIEAPATVLAEVKRSQDQFHVHLVNYAREPVKSAVRVEFSRQLDPGRSTFAAPMETRPEAAIAAKAAGPDRYTIDLPPFADYAVVTLAKKPEGSVSQD
ncbi:MAG: hypothetical protein PHO07_20055 [Pirellulales bacterium]|nr:hypothetical protein [Pirellulales bacterium]